MTALETVEDAFLSALEDGADPPKAFTIFLPIEAGIPAGHVLRVAGYTVTIEHDQ